MKKKLEQLINAKEKRLADLRKRAKETEDIAELRALNEDVDDIIDELRELKEMYGNVDKPRDGDRKPDGGDNGNDNVDVVVDEGRSLDPVAAMKMNNGGKNKRGKVDKFDTPEYREAFMNFVCRGVPIPAEMRQDAVTTTTDAGAVIPTTILRELIKEVSVYGNLFDEIRHLNIQGGVQVPILTLKPEATWITADTGTKESDTQKLEANTYVSFNYYGLECKIAQTLLTSVTTLEMFQEQFVPLAAEAMAKALDIAVMNGSGSGEPLGITNDSRVPTGNVITLSAADMASWSGWKKKVFAKMKKAYRGGKFYMAQGTFDGYIDGMVDDNGQPIGRVNYGIDGDERYRFAGRIVDTVEDDVIKAYDDASSGDVIAVYLKPKDYAFNSNLTMTAKKWVDDDTNTIKNKLILIGDGKLLDPYGVLIIKKGS
jgi:HK97 family phage major capsid protein